MLSKRHVASFGAFWFHNNFIFNSLALIQSSKTVLLNGRIMDEYVLRTVIRLNEAVALFFIEPLYLTSGHVGLHHLLSNIIEQMDHRIFIKSRK